jgi:hypothetical protein
MASPVGKLRDFGHFEVVSKTRTEEEETRTYTVKIPDQVWRHGVNSFLDKREIARMHGVCKAWSGKYQMGDAVGSVLFSVRVQVLLSKVFNARRVARYRFQDSKPEMPLRIGRAHRPEPLTAEGLAMLCNEAPLWEVAELDFLELDQLKQILEANPSFARVTRLSLKLDARLYEDRMFKGMLDLSEFSKRLGACFPQVRELTLTRALDDHIALLTVQMPNLTRLSLSRGCWSQQEWLGAERIRNACKQLQEVHFEGDLNDRELENLSCLPLCSIVPSGGAITGKFMGTGFKAFSQSRHLTRASFICCDDLTDAGVAALAQIPSLRKLEIANCHHLTIAALRELAQAPALHELKIYAWQQIYSDEDFIGREVAKELGYACEERVDMIKALSGLRVQRLMIDENFVENAKDFELLAKSFPKNVRSLFYECHEKSQCVNIVSLINCCPQIQQVHIFVSKVIEDIASVEKVIRSGLTRVVDLKVGAFKSYSEYQIPPDFWQDGR